MGRVVSRQLLVHGYMYAANTRCAVDKHVLKNNTFIMALLLDYDYDGTISSNPGRRGRLEQWHARRHDF
jgi:hypothetical protein